jgi:hypothetical protein
VSAWTDFLEKVKAQNFGPDDSQIVSSLVHPARGLGKFGEFLQQSMQAASQATMRGDNQALRDNAVIGANNLAGLMQTGAIPFAPSGRGTLGTFIGPKSEGWSHEVAAKASKLLDEGVDPTQVWKQHLIGRMPDKSLFSEIDDSVLTTQGTSVIKNAVDPKAIMKGAPVSMSLRSWLDHPELYKKYPDAQDITLEPIPDKNFHGKYDPMTDVMNISTFSPDMKSTVLHEGQHAIQDREGWARGGNPSDINLDEFAPLRQKEYNDIGNVLLPDTMKRYKEATSQSEKDAILAERRSLMSRQHQMQKQTPDDIQMEIYKRLTGEAQSRATQERMDKPMEWRRENYPLANDKLSDIPLKDLINRYDTGIQSHVMKRNKK